MPPVRTRNARDRSPVTGNCQPGTVRPAQAHHASFGSREPAAGIAAGQAQPRLSRGVVLLLATACGAAVANLYYAQPLLHVIAAAFGVPDAEAGLLVTVTQIGYAAGLALLVPLGDLLERRRLIVGMLALTTVALAGAAAAPGLVALAAALAMAAVASVTAQVIVPLAASLAADSERGRVVGTVMSGLLIGILLARTLSGVLAAAAGWRAVFLAAAALMASLAVALRRALPRSPGAETLAYRALLRSVVALVREEPVLRLRMALGAAAMGSFSILWTSVTFLLAGPRFRYGSAVVGLFGLAGLAGALAAPMAGRVSDRGRGHLATLAALAILVASWGLLAWGGTSLGPLIAGIVALDLGTQVLHISNQSAIYALRPQARSRLNTAYMVAYFLGGATMTAAASATYAQAGWDGVCALGAATVALALALASANARRTRASLKGRAC